MNLIKTEEIKNWSLAKKVRPIKAKPMVSLMVDKSVLSKFVLDTLEGKEALGDGSVMCIGETGDVWQQMPTKLLQKYDVIGIDNDGWMVCEPKKENSVECFEITPAINPMTTYLYADSGPYCIIAEWGEDATVFNTPVKVQWAEPGDYICRNRTTPSDVWIVKRKIFNSTYVIMN